MSDIAKQLRSSDARASDINAAADHIDRLQAALAQMTFYAALLVDPKAHGTFWPHEALDHLNDARALLERGTSP